MAWDGFARGGARNGFISTHDRTMDAYLPFSRPKLILRYPDDRFRYSRPPAVNANQQGTCLARIKPQNSGQPSGFPANFVLRLVQPTRVAILPSKENVPTPEKDAPVVLLVHGVGSKGEWFAQVERALGAHFQVVRTRHNHFLWRSAFGPIAAIVEPFLVLAAAAWWFWSDSPFLHRHLLAYSVAAFVVGALLAEIRLAWAIRAVRRQLEPSIALGRPTHAVAHSLGTRILIHLARDFRLRFRNVVLVGSILSYWCKWSQIPHLKGMRVRNEVGWRDPAVWLSLIFGVRSGGAGVVGFRLTPHVHSCPIDGKCSQCALSEEAPVHNVSFPPHLHSDAFVGPMHVVEMWLPYFLDYGFDEFHRFHTACREALAVGSNQKKKAARIRGLLSQKSLWGNKTLQQRIEQAIREHPEGVAGKIPQQLVLSVTAEVLNRVSEAGEQLTSHSPDSEKQRSLDPERAVVVATDRVLAERTKRKLAKLKQSPGSGGGTT